MMKRPEWRTFVVCWLKAAQTTSLPAPRFHSRLTLVLIVDRRRVRLWRKREPVWRKTDDVTEPVTELAKLEDVETDDGSRLETELMDSEVERRLWTALWWNGDIMVVVFVGEVGWRAAVFGFCEGSRRSG